MRVIKKSEVFRYRVIHVWLHFITLEVVFIFLLNYPTIIYTTAIINKSIYFCITSIVPTELSIDAGSRHAYYYIPICRTVVFEEKGVEVTVSFVFFSVSFP